jgi:hypothetical protein
MMHTDEIRYYFDKGYRRYDIAEIVARKEKLEFEEALWIVEQYILAYKKRRKQIHEAVRN